jgi:acyl carrier protein
VQVYLLDHNLEPVPAGVPGEIYLGGAGLARGYLNRPELTAERFIPNRFAPESGARLYRTGDLARHLPDGRIEYAGRLDHQVKVRGFRIEPGEIENLLIQHEEVKQAVVIAREDLPGDQRLVAYLVADPERPPIVNQLRSHLQDRLPQFMIPSLFVLMEALPTTPNGKLDRDALPTLESRRPDLEQLRVVPRNEIESAIAEIWKEVLRVDEVGIDDNFFDLGGHSLLLILMHGKLRQAFGKDLSLIELFNYPTIGALAEYFRSTTETEDPAGDDSIFDRIMDRAKKQRAADLGRRSSI